LNKKSLRQALLPTSKGGIGLRSATDHSVACYIASLSSASRHSSLKLEVSDELFDELNLLVDKNDPLVPCQDIAISQKALSSQIDKESLRILLSEADTYSSARIRSVLAPHASAWLSVIPSPNLGLKFNNAQYQTTLKLHLGVPVYPTKSKCPCGKHKLDRYGIQSIICKAKGDIISRHNAVRDVIYSVAKDAGLAPEKEKAGILGDHGDKRRPADVYLPNFSLQKDYCLDIAITSPLQHKYLEHSAKVDGYAADHYFGFKMTKYAKDVEDAGHIFKPIVFETFGRVANESYDTLVKIAIRKAERFSSSQSETIRQFFQHLSVTLQIRNANMVLKRDSN
jgi:hypothetical protein